MNILKVFFAALVGGSVIFFLLSKYILKDTSLRVIIMALLVSCGSALFVFILNQRKINKKNQG